jgi:hypothetical protein
MPQKASNGTAPALVVKVTTIHAEDLEMSVRRALNLVGSPLGLRILTATWDQQTTPVQLASLIRT